MKSTTQDLSVTVSDERFKLLVDSIADYAIFLLDQNGRIESWNTGAERLKGYSASEAIGKHFSIFYTEKDIKRNHPKYELEVALREGIFKEEGWRVRKDGTTFWAYVVITKILDENQNHIGFAKVTRDLTERKLAEEKLKESEEKYRLLVSSVKDYAIFMLDPEGKIATWNEGAENLKGYHPEEIIGKHFSIFYPEEDINNKKPEMELKESALIGRFEDEGWRLRKDGSRFWANVVISAVKNKGELIGFSKVTRDITSRMHLEKELKASNEILDQRVKERTEQLEKAIEFRDEFISIVSHELRTPVTSLKLQVQSAIRQFTRDTPEIFHTKAGTFFQKADKQLDKIGLLLNDILDVSRISMDRLYLEKEKTNLTQMIADTIGQIELQAIKAGSSIMFNYQDPVYLEVDTMRLEQVFANLLSNSIKYGEGKDIQIDIRVTNSKVEIDFKDEGIGIESSDQQKIFERFVRATNKNIVGGIGVGLFISQKIVEAHEGELTVNSELGKGSTFTVTLNRAAL